MPNCFTLTAIGDCEPSSLNKIDTELWDKFNGGEPEGNDQWLWGWYDCIGLALACGKTLEDCVSLYKKGGDMHTIAEYLQENFTVNSWYQHK